MALKVPIKVFCKIVLVSKVVATKWRIFLLMVMSGNQNTTTMSYGFFIAKLIRQ